jgi:peptide/nickel transport system substrate-binding protein
VSVRLAAKLLPWTIIFGLGACGGDSDMAGGTLKVLSAGDVDSVDPGIAYTQFGYMVSYATQRPLYSWPPNETDKPTPDLAEGDPNVTNGDRTVTVKIKDGVRFSPPVDREVVAGDVKYAIERGATPNVANGYIGTYFNSLQGFDQLASGRASAIKGIQTPDDHTVVFQLVEPIGVLAVAEALSLPLTAPVPKEYARKFDRREVSTYGQHQVATGPYMIQNDASGKSTGYKPGQRITLVRNPAWNPDTDYRDARADRIEIDEGNDPTVATRQILSGRGMIGSDFSPPPAMLKQALNTRREQIELAPSGGNRYIALNTTIPPLNNVNVRRAIAAATNREALLLTRGGEAIGEVATHFIPPDVSGFEDAGGNIGPGYDFLARPQGNLPLAEDYMRKAGYRSGKYEGGDRLFLVAAVEEPDYKTAEVAQDSFERLGFKLQSRFVSTETMYTKFCAVPKAEVAICPNVGLAKDFNDAQSFLDPAFNGRSIVPVNNSNWPQLDDRGINAAIERAKHLTDPAERARAWGEIDRRVTALAAAVPWAWDDQPNVRSSDVDGVVNRFNALWDLSFTVSK